MSHDDHFNIDPAFNAENAEVEIKREFQIEWEDRQQKDGSVSCRDCDNNFDPRTMYNRVEDGHTWKICGRCEGVGHPSYKMEGDLK